MSKGSALLSADVFRDHRSQLAKVVLLMCGVYFALAFASQAWKAKGLGETLAQEQHTLAVQQAENSKLEARLSYLNGPGYPVYVERTARAELSMAKPGDVPLFVVPDPNAPNREPESPLPASDTAALAEPDPVLPIWRQWVSIFFP